MLSGAAVKALRLGGQSWEQLQHWNLEEWSCCLGQSPAGERPWPGCARGADGEVMQSLAGLSTERGAAACPCAV